MCGADRRGFSLAEALVACVLTLLILTLIFQVVIPMARGTVRGSQQIELQQVAGLAMNRLSEDLQSAPPSGVTLVPAGQPTEPVILAMHGLEGIDATGSQVYSDHLVVYWWRQSDGRLWRKTWPPGQPSGRYPATDEVFEPTADELRALVADRNTTERVQASQVK
ncbi:MAG: hypothetical protein AB1758_22920, partial [Candidatus Eremiobacterota bacterium]